ncbi:cytochrome c3 family protein [Hwangdonia seohaensis]|uniref:Cytochrome c3 family protein n=1 Tax=Hwangdonia seohaensis TaxID=1240727 RepID=A0ABW3RAA4_9FLAO|nr:cytochrome c3 family protein [Hwangdonia seohaensis]
MNRENYIYILACLFVLVFFSCKHGEGEYHSLHDKIQAESISHQDSTLSSEAFFNHYKTMEITEGGHTFLIPERKSQITSYACTECHTEPLDELKGKDLKKAHWDITLAHANSNTMNCATCHNGSDMNNLNTLTGIKVDFNSSYKLCAQCHSSQFEDWKGGAHGKRIGGWAPPRASLTCVNCHNPHSPSIESRWPSRFNTEQIEGAYEGLEH